MTLEKLAERTGLRVAGLLPAEPQDKLPPDTGSIALLAPCEPAFWAEITAAPEWQDEQSDPIDRWSTRVITGIANRIGGTAVFPFGGAPYWPFYTWALRSGQAFVSPVSLLMDPRAGLFASYRGAVLLPDPVTPRPVDPPCATCADQPCRTACPVGALTSEGYDVPACHAYLDSPAGADCLTGGCVVRRSCPVGAGLRLPTQSAYHMSRFHEVP